MAQVTKRLDKLENHTKSQNSLKKADEIIHAIKHTVELWAAGD